MTLSPPEARNFRKYLAVLRKAKGFTQAELSEKLGFAHNYIGRIETGEIETPPLEVQAKIAEYLDVSISDLFFFEGYGDSPEELRARIQRLIETNDIKKLRKYYRLLLVATEES
jgi:transcriptional regulator with XRE-family HTH domain